MRWRERVVINHFTKKRGRERKCRKKQSEEESDQERMLEIEGRTREFRLTRYESSMWILEWSMEEEKI
jgi:hypothetical protein